MAVPIPGGPRQTTADDKAQTFVDVDRPRILRGNLQFQLFPPLFPGEITQGLQQLTANPLSGVGLEKRDRELRPVAVSPEVEDMRETMDQIAREYMAFRSRMDQATSRDTARAAAVTKKLQKLRKYMNDLLNG